ncbi:hypothetical protein DTO021C3_8810 [Paecilomyces variotii]|nr:hypothetical protein DTO021C3_8810 [Paecilomyces variotii]
MPPSAAIYYHRLGRDADAGEIRNPGTLLLCFEDRYYSFLSISAWGVRACPRTKSLVPLQKVMIPLMKNPRDISIEKSRNACAILRVVAGIGL